MFYAIDRGGALSNLRRTPTGGYLVDARLARTGRMKYPRGEGGSTEHENTAEVLQASLADIGALPVTNRHPPQFVTADTYRKYASGHPVGTATFDGEYIVTTLAIQDSELIHDIELGVSREVSMGYSFDGEINDEGVLTRTKIEWNHIAILPAGRAGSHVGLVLDSNEIPNQDEVKVALKINGAEVADAQAQAAIDSLEGQLAALQAANDELKAAQAKAEAALAVAVSDEAIDAAVQARLDREKAAQAKAEKLARVAAGYPKLVLDGKSDDYMDALDAALAERLAADVEGLSKVKDSAPGGEFPTAPKPPKLTPREEMIERNRAMAASR